MVFRIHVVGQAVCRAIPISSFISRQCLVLCPLRISIKLVIFSCGIGKSFLKVVYFRNTGFFEGYEVSVDDSHDFRGFLMVGTCGACRLR